MRKADMDRTQAEDARAIAQMTRWTLVMLQNAERGLVPVKALDRTVDPSVLAALGPITPPPPGQPRAKPRVGRLRVHLVHDELAHVACVAGRPDGRPAGYVLEFRREPGQREWRITEMSRVEERRLVGPDAKLHAVSDRGGVHRMPADITSAVRAAEQAHTDAQAAMEKATASAQDLRDRIAKLQGKSTWKVRERISLAEQERVARMNAARWQRAVSTIKAELRELNDVRELREARRLVADGDPLMRVRNPEHLEQLLGPVPNDREDRAAWRQAASTVERYRQTWAIDDPEDAMGALPADAPGEQVRQHSTAVLTAERYRERSREAKRDSARALEISLEG